MRCANYFLVALFALTPVTLMAEPQHHRGMEAGPHGGHHKMQHGGHMKSGKHDKRKKSPVHLFTDHWAKTLTEQQKLAIDDMHLKVGQFEVVQKAKVKLLKAELAVIAANTPVDKNAMYAKIDEIMEVKKSIMRNRYDHIAEMREVLTKEQRLSYDAGLLKDKKHKH